MNFENGPVAFVDGKPWTNSRPPFTPQSKLKPVPGIEPLPKLEENGKKSEREGMTEFRMFSKKSNEIKICYILYKWIYFCFNHYIPICIFKIKL